jgi:ankyrin repeat protein
MKTIKNLAIAITLFTTNIFCMDTPPQKNWLQITGDVILGKLPVPNSFPDLFKKEQKNLIRSLSAFRHADNLAHAGQTIRILIKQNEALNLLVNERDFTLKLVTYLSNRFNIDNQTVCQYLKTAAAAEILAMQILAQESCIKRTGLKFFKQIYRQGVDPNFIYRRGETLLLSCIENNALLIMRFLLKKGANPNFFLQGQETPLTRSIELGNELAVESLLEFGADPELVSDSGFSPLQAAIFRPNSKIIGLLNKAITNKRAQMRKS